MRRTNLVEESNLTLIKQIIQRKSAEIRLLAEEPAIGHLEESGRTLVPIVFGLASRARIKINHLAPSELDISIIHHQPLLVHRG